MSVSFAAHTNIFPKKNTVFVPIPEDTHSLTKTMRALVENDQELIPNSQQHQFHRIPMFGEDTMRDSFYNSSMTRYNPHLVYEPTNIMGYHTIIDHECREPHSYVPLNVSSGCYQIKHGYQKRFLNPQLSGSS